MRILVISNLYPPYYIGGYELGCKDVVDALKERGHEVHVLTSTYGVDQPIKDGNIYRWLKHDFGLNIQDFLKYILVLAKKEYNNQKAFKYVSKEVKPDLVYIWNLTHISVSSVFIAREIGIPVSFYIFDHWLAKWEKDLWYALSHHRSRRLRGRVALKLIRILVKLCGIKWLSGDIELNNVQFASNYLKESTINSGKNVHRGEVIHWGIDTEKFPYKETVNYPKRLLYVGQIYPHKGLHTAIEAVGEVIARTGDRSIKLTVAGGNIEPHYMKELRNIIKCHALEENINFIGFIPREYISQIYHAHDILIFPSIWDEPFGIVLLEAMSSGLAVVGTATGGSKEIIEHEVNALVFPKGDAKACAENIIRLFNDYELFERIRKNGRSIVEKYFRFEDTIRKIENSLKEVI